MNVDFSGSPQDRARSARILLRACDRGALATIFAGAPYASLALLAADLDGSPLFLLSDLAQSTRNLKADPRASLMVSAAGEGGGDPLDSPRLTLLGEMRPATDSRVRRRYLARQPQSALYADFGDFRFYRMEVARAHFIGGFGKIAWIEGRNLILPDNAARLAAIEEALAEKMNREYRSELALCVNRLAGRGGTGWQITGIDPDGLDLRSDENSGRLDFAAPVLDEQSFHAALSTLATTARREA